VVRIALTSVFLLALFPALFAGAERAGAAPPEVRIHGAYCPPVGCPAAPDSALGSGAGFATAAATALLIGRRRRQAATVIQRNELEEPGIRPPLPSS
jgi:hypothetical protein